MLNFHPKSEGIVTFGFPNIEEESKGSKCTPLDLYPQDLKTSTGALFVLLPPGFSTVKIKGHFCEKSSTETCCPPPPLLINL